MPLHSDWDIIKKHPDVIQLYTACGELFSWGGNLESHPDNFSLQLFGIPYCVFGIFGRNAYVFHTI